MQLTEIAMRFKTLDEWLSWQESLNPKEIDLGLDRVSEVLHRLGFSAEFFCPVITVAGTNGKGSCVAFIESILQHAGKRVGCYTSPHLFKYNERIRINQQPVDDDLLCEAFEKVDQVRGDIPLTYFEFGTLASLVIFHQQQLDVVVLEVGLGGRLDAVNVLDADIAVITSIGLDHVDWLGSDLESIGFEKAGIMRSGKPCVVSMVTPPSKLLEHAQQQSVPLLRLGHDYLFQRLSDTHWQLRGDGVYYSELPVPALKGDFQLQNAAAAIMAVNALGLLELTQVQLQQGLQQLVLQGRYQELQSEPQLIVDVAHNEQSAQALAETLQTDKTSGKTLAVIAMLADKDIAGVIRRVAPEVDYWLTAGLHVPRGLSAKNMQLAVREQSSDDTLSACNDVAEACQLALKMAHENDRVVVFGSFYTVAEAMTFFESVTA